jgi:hypothetical protein
MKKIEQSNEWIPASIVPENNYYDHYVVLLPNNRVISAWRENGRWETNTVGELFNVRYYLKLPLFPNN